ncbi:ankyrin repeat domain-containing protein [Vibrio sp. Isolate22]|uniref:ankyrin repeat domain-containing protein n=1 Tax=Vibrio sp. Isolate22 TaxID=2908532 RepID=UPI001EFC33A9|nr:ankyrin repeat domain-containing protein [Vibrio sp. Isolate22]MCG9692594.1 ankyrin repeat domain-containing protein [Vibrio sp. Isolate22]
MSNKWSNYKNTYRSNSDIFDCARSGDLPGLVRIISERPEMDLNEKNHRGYSALMLAVYYGEKDFCEALLRCGADVNSTDTKRNTPLMASAFKGQLEIFKLLVKFNASVTSENHAGMTAREWALVFKRAEIVTYIDEILPSVAKQTRQGSIKKILKLGGLSLLNLLHLRS